MTAIITENYRVFLAEKMKEASDPLLTSKNLYLFIGRSLPWESPNSDTSPPSPTDTVLAQNQTWSTMLAMKKVVESSVSHVIPRFDWTTGTIYVPYDDTDVNLYVHPTAGEIAAASPDPAGSFYVITDDFNVYKCLDNNGGANSTTKPTGTATTYIETADGYKWRYMYTVSAAETLKYVTSEWIPVKTISGADDGSDQWDVQDAAVDGSIEIVKVTNGGSGYTNVRLNQTAQSGTSNTITLDGLASGTDDIYNGATIFITSGTGAGQSKLITDYDGTTKQASISPASWSVTPDGTSVFDIVPTVTITGDGTGCIAKATVSGGVVTRIDVTSNGADGGSGYHLASVSISGCGGTGATARAIISPPGGHGSDATNELGGGFIMANVRLSYEEGEGDFPISNDYREIGLVADVFNYNTTTISTANTLYAVKRLTVTPGSGTFLPDEEITSNGAATPTAIVIEPNDDGTVISYLQNLTTGFDAFATSETLTGTTSGATATITALGNPEVEPYSGKILYVQKRRPISRDSEQLEDVKLILEM